MKRKRSEPKNIVVKKIAKVSSKEQSESLKIMGKLSSQKSKLKLPKKKHPLEKMKSKKEEKVAKLRVK